MVKIGKNIKTPDEVAEKEMNKLIGKAMAKRQMKINQLQAEIKKLKSGEMAPDAEDGESSVSDPKEEKVMEIIREEHHHHHHEKKEDYPNRPCPVPDHGWT